MADKQSKSYWVQRELDHAEDIKKSVNDELKVTQNLYNQALENITNEINRNYVNYSKSSGMKMEDAMKFVDIADVRRFNDQVKKYVKDRDFSERANADLKLYNLKIRVSRLKFMQLQMGLEIDKLNGKVVDSTQDFLNKQALDEYKRQSSILGDSLDYSKSAINSIVNANYSLGGNGSYSFSSNIWNNQEKLKNKLNETLNRAILQGKNPNQFISDFKKIFDVQPSQVGRLLITETARVQGDVQRDSYKQSGIDMYDIVYERRACQTCISIAKSGPYELSKAEVGTNMYPFHPNCMCSIMPSLSKSSVSSVDKGNAKTVKSSNASTKTDNKQPKRTIKNKQQTNIAKKEPNNNSYDPNSLDSMNKYLKSEYGIQNNLETGSEVLSKFVGFLDKFNHSHPTLNAYKYGRLDALNSISSNRVAGTFGMNKIDFKNKDKNYYTTRIDMNKSIYKDLKSIEEAEEKATTSGWTMKGDPYTRTFAHEYGHHVENVLKHQFAVKNGNENYLNIDKKIDNKFYKKFYSDVIRELGGKPSRRLSDICFDVKRAGYVSEYGKTSIVEFFAEQFSHAYTYDGERDKLSHAFESVVEKWVKGLK